MTHWILDLYAGVGGATRGFLDAGYEVVGVDTDWSPSYPGEDAGALLVTGKVETFTLPFGRRGPPLMVFADPPTSEDRRKVVKLLDRFDLPWCLAASPKVPGLLMCGTQLGQGWHNHRTLTFSARGWNVYPPPGVCPGIPGPTRASRGQGFVADRVFHRVDEATALGLPRSIRAYQLAQVFPPVFAQTLVKWLDDAPSPATLRRAAGRSGPGG